MWEYNIRKCIIRLHKGVQVIHSKPVLTILCVLYWCVALGGVWVYTPDNILSRLLFPFVAVLTVALAVLLFLILIMACGTAPGATRMERDFQRIGLTNRAGEPPIVISITPCGNNQKKQITLLSGGIPIEVYRDNLSELESILNMHIVQLYEGKDCESIMFDVISGNVKTPEKIDWSDESLPAKESVLALGENLNGQITVDLSVTPHLLVGGSTGSGKTVLVKALIYQALAKGMEVYLMDMKGGLDYPPHWKNQCCSFCADNQDALSMLSGLIEELNRRKGLLGQLNCANIDKYNQQADETDQMPRIIIVLDEIAELTDTTGMDKPHKELAQRTVAHLSTIARMGRAYGIHLIVGTQRPDATILPGQVKNNCDIRICGRADNVLSMIILDNTDAADRISKDKRGRFLMQDGTEFQGYWINL
jgi:S-DNA-T family DNA segregation ATPase FtsK/SpoIIIE